MLERDIALLMDTTPEGRMDAGWQSGVMRQRAKTAKAGRHLYLDSYPIWDTRTTREAKAKAARIREKHRDAVDKVNARIAQRKLELLLNANFGPGDMLLTCTYRPGEDPEDEKQASRDVTNMILRLRRLYAKAGVELKYVYVTEVQRKRKGDRYHHHMILSAGPGREQVEELWTRKHGGLCNTRRVQPQPEGLTGWARYITKSAAGYGKGQEIATRRRWCASRNLHTPRPTVADKKISRRRVERIAWDMSADSAAAREVLEKLYPGYRLLECTVRTSAFVAGAYISAVMVQDDGGGGRISPHKKTRRENR